MYTDQLVIVGPVSFTLWYTFSAYAIVFAGGLPGVAILIQGKFQ